MFRWVKRLWNKIFGSTNQNSDIIDVDAEVVDDLTDIDHHYENLVFEGGGVKGLSLSAAVVELDKLGILDDITRFAGSSAGSIVAAGLAIGYTPKEMVKIMLKTDFSTFVDDSVGIIRDTNRLVKKYGFAKGKYFEEWVSNLIIKKTGDGNYTFKKLFKDTGRELVITGTNLTQQRLVLFSHLTYPDMPIHKAIRISMSIPYLFVPVKFEGDYYVDGGMLYNYPINVFGNSNKHTLGIKMVTDNEHKTDLIQHGGQQINSLIDFSISIIKLLLLEIERQHVDDDYWNKTITINTGHVSTTDFNLSKNDIQFLYKQGKNAVREFFNIQ